MLLTVLNAAGTPQTIVAAGQEAVQDISGILPDDLWNLVAPLNPLRSGIVIQNLGGAQMSISELPELERNDQNSWVIAPGASWPPAGYPPVTNAIYIKGALGDAYAAREW